MPRHARLMLPGIPVHVVQRGHNRGACFFAKADYRTYLEQLAALAPELGCALHAYCLMTNHVHLLLTPTTAADCGRLMKQLGQRHTQYINRVYRRGGTLWGGRFRSCLVGEDYLMACQRYIELNPVRAGLVREPGEHPWSSHVANASGEAGSPLTPHALYLSLGARPAQRAAAYAALFDVSLEPDTVQSIRDATNGDYALGGAEFQAAIARQAGRRVVPGKPGRPRKPELSGSVPA